MREKMQVFSPRVKVSCCSLVLCKLKRCDSGKEVEAWMLLKLTLQIHILCQFCPSVSSQIYPGVCLTYFPKGKQRESKGLTASVEGTSGVQARSERFQLLVFLGQHNFVNLHCMSLHITLYFQILKMCCQNMKCTSNEVLLRGVPIAFMSINYLS